LKRKADFSIQSGWCEVALRLAVGNRGDWQGKRSLPEKFDPWAIN